GEETVCVSLLVAAELRFGAARKQSARLTQQVEAVLSVLPILALETPVDAHYAEIRVELETSGNPIGPNDLIIAAHARALSLTLVTHNLVEFSRVPGLLVQNWLGLQGAVDRGWLRSHDEQAQRTLPHNRSSR